MIKGYSEWSLTESRGIYSGTIFDGGMLPGTKNTLSYKIIKKIAGAGEVGMRYSEIKDYIRELVPTAKTKSWFDTQLFDGPRGKQGLLYLYCISSGGRWKAKPEVLDWFMKNDQPEEYTPSRPVKQLDLPKSTIEFLDKYCPMWKISGKGDNMLIRSHEVNIVGSDITEIPVNFTGVYKFNIENCPNLTTLKLPIQEKESARSLSITNCTAIQEVIGDFDIFSVININGKRYVMPDDFEKLEVTPKELIIFNSDWTF